MKTISLFITFAFFIAFGSSFAQIEKSDWDKDQVAEEEAYSIGAQAYLYYTAPFMLYQVVYSGQNLPFLEYKSGVPFNVWTKVSEISNTKNTRNPMPNVNTLYASAWFDVRVEPLVLEIPKTGNRYYSVALMDAYMNNFKIIGSRTIGPFGGTFLICSDDFTGVVPDGMEKIASPTPLIWAVQRIAPEYINETEINVCREIQNKINITPLSQFGSPNYDMLTYNTRLDLGVPDISKEPLKFFEIANEFVNINPPPAADEGVMSIFSRLGLGTGRIFKSENLSEPQKKGLLRGMEAGKEMINAYVQKDDNLYNGWVIPPKDGGNYGTNYLLRAAYTMERIGALSPDEAMYLTVYNDIDGKLLDGMNNYKIHFKKEELPEVYAFWSVTLYDYPSVMLYDNEINRYQMGPQIQEMKYNSDGSLDIYIQHKKPADNNIIGNWLPSPEGRFLMTLRFYNPKPVMFSLDKHLTPLPGVFKTN
ncbi:MAG: DUF1254 domain-containing protein [Ignavibacteria bacterium]|nr:DUF1254 domain-containing protein [Ignavibacteria bacterium]